MKITEEYRKLSLEDRKKFLEEELEETNKKINKLDAPKAKEDIDWRPLLDLCESFINDYENEGYSKDDEHWAYETAMEVIYGENVWGWINKKCENRPC